HVYKSVDGGATFTALPNFPNIGCNWIARKHSTGELFIATDKGVVYSKDEGQSWFALEQGLPNVQVLAIRLRGANDQYLLAGTYGRGMFKLDITGLTSVDEPKTAPSASIVTLNTVSPNPITNGNGTVNFSLSKNTVVTATIYDVLGRTAKILAKSPFGEGKHSLNFTTNDLPSGAYILSVAADGVAKTQRIVIE
ncbi:MAG TPA: T9SS type A sorting domain-containing protein, partial [Candidatus Kapabacteria bacterium]